MVWVWRIQTTLFNLIIHFGFMGIFANFTLFEILILSTTHKAFSFNIC